MESREVRFEGKSGMIDNQQEGHFMRVSHRRTVHNAKVELG